ncbi:MAG: M14 family zinc carboxypeptidase [Acidobacteria bacterium]|nr:M14 family zinc carboxypeptidase [Acidobacteriota bacterium]
MVFALSAVLATVAATWPQQPDLPPGTRIVRAYFDDPLVAARAVISLDALESEYEKGYIVLLATDDDIEAARRAGMRVVEDEDHTAVALPSEAPTAVIEGTIAGFPCYRTVEGTYARARALVDAYPDLASWRWAGRSWKKERRSSDGYVLHVLRLTNSATSGRKPVLFITAALHAREYATAELVLRFAEYLVDSYDSDADVRWLLDHQEVHLMLQANPDGRKRAEEGVLWRKNHNTNHCADSVPGVDLNRNFTFGWNHPGGASDNGCSQVFRGPGPASEPETRAVGRYMARLFPDARGPANSDAAHPGTSGVYLDIHSHGRLILWPWGHRYEPAPNATALRTLGRRLASFNDYLPTQGIGFYPATGTTLDHAYGELGVASFLYELGTTFFQDCGDFEDAILDGNLESLLYAFKVARTPYLTPAGPDVRDLTLGSGSSTPGVAAGSPVRLSAIFDDTRYQNSNGTEPTQTIAAGEYTVDVPPWKTEAVARAISAADGSFDSGSESATARIDTSGLETGRHTVFVRAKDADGNWGAVSAVFLFVQATDDPGSGENGSCAVDENTVCLHDARYDVRVTWLAGNGRTEAARAASSSTEDSALFWFFDPDNWEVLVKVLDGCALNDHVWVYGASTTDLGYSIRVTDTATGVEREYRNEPGVPASAIVDATAFPDGCRPP